MKFLNKIKSALSLAAISAVVLVSCNKDLEQFPVTPDPVPSGTSIAAQLASGDDSLFYRIIEKGGMLPTLSDLSRRFTVIATPNAALKPFLSAASGGAIPVGAPDAVFSAFIRNNLPAANATVIAQYNILPGSWPTAAIPNVFANYASPTFYNPAPSASALLRLTSSLSIRNGFYINNIPVANPDIMAANGYIHEMPTIVLPASAFLWDRINTDADMTIFKAAVLRADSAGPSLVPALQSIGVNFTVFVPTNLAMKVAISGLTGGALPVAAPDAAFIGFLGSNFVTTQTVTGLVVYHIFDGRNTSNRPLGLRVQRPGRAFLVDFPTTPQFYPTLLNSDSAAAIHPGLQLNAVFTGSTVTSATVKGLGNATPSNILINPATNGTSDQKYLNGTIQKIDQVLIPF